jgi:hypothetical protein
MALTFPPLSPYNPAQFLTVRQSLLEGTAPASHYGVICI